MKKISTCKDLPNKSLSKYIILALLFVSLVFFGGEFRVEKAQASFLSGAIDLYNKAKTTIQTKKDQYDQNKAKYDEAKSKVDQYKADAKAYQDYAKNKKAEAIKLKDKLFKKKSPAEGTISTAGSGTINLVVYPQLIKEDQKLQVKYNIKDPKAKSFYLAITRPNSSLNLTKASACQIIKTASLTEKNGLYAKRYQNCALGSCNDSFDYVLTQTNLETNYKIKVVGFTTSDEGEENCNNANIIDLAQQELTVEKGVGGSTPSDENRVIKIKGSIRIESPSMIDNGNTAIIDINLKEHKDDEMMLWITDCDGTLVPKIDINNHQGRAVPSDPYIYKYAWDTQAAQTKSCKHIVKVKTFSKDSAGKWAWNDQAQYKITVGDNTADAKQLCVMQLDDLTAEQGDKNPSTITVDNKITVKSGKVKIKWNGVCGATYKVYRDDILLGTTSETSFEDALDSSGEYKYRVDAYISKSAFNGPADPTDGGKNNYDPNLSWNRFFNKAVAAGFFLPVKAADDDEMVASKELILNYESAYKNAATAGNSKDCSAGQIQLGLPLPEKVGNSFQLKYCADNLSEYMQTIYDFLIVIASLSAVIMILIGGYMYISSIGDATKINTAKEMIIGALIGLVLLISAGFIIDTIGISK